MQRFLLAAFLFVVALAGFIVAIIATLGMASPTFLADLPTRTPIGPLTQQLLLTCFVVGCLLTTVAHLVEQRLIHPLGVPDPDHPEQKLRAIAQALRD